MRTFGKSSLILLSLLLASCDSFYIPLLTPYKMDIRQGNFVTPAMREKLQVGMTKPQVRYVLGTAMIEDVFHADRWDYVFTLQRQGAQPLEFAPDIDPACGGFPRNPVGQEQPGGHAAIHVTMVTG